MSSIFDITSKPTMLQRIDKVVVFNCRRPKPDYIDENVILTILKNFALDFIFFDNYDDFYKNMEKYKEYCNNILFLNEAPKTKEESEIILKLKPKHILWITYPNFFIALAEFKRHNLVIPNEPTIPFSVFSSALERYFLYNIAKRQDIPGAILEIGAYSGGTSIALALGNKSSKYKNIIFSVDKQFQDDYDYFMESVDVKDSIVKNENYSKDFSKIAKDIFIKNSGKAELRILWIDGDHSYEGTKFDIATYSKYLMDGGVLMIHDYGIHDSHHGGIPKAVWEEIVNSKEYSNFALIGSIFYAEKNRKDRLIDFSNLISNKNSPLNVVNWLSKQFDFSSKKVYLYGAGLHTEEVLKLSETINKTLYNSILGLIDDNEANIGNSLREKKIMKLKNVIKLGFDYIIPSSFDYENQIIEKLYKKIEQKSKIIPIYTNPQFMNDNKSEIPIIRDFSMLYKVLGTN